MGYKESDNARFPVSYNYEPYAGFISLPTNQSIPQAFHLPRVCLKTACAGLDVPLCGRQFAKTSNLRKTAIREKQQLVKNSKVQF
jgi:hypothetical protein